MKYAFCPEACPVNVEHRQSVFWCENCLHFDDVKLEPFQALLLTSGVLTEVTVVGENGTIAYIKDDKGIRRTHEGRLSAKLESSSEI